jgi:crossover junction endodeoxyribonuclease RusA
MTALEFTVDGVPVGQGSKRYLKPGVMVESSKRHAPWRADVRAGAQLALGDEHADLWDAPIAVSLTFRFPRPKSHYGTGRNSQILKPSAPYYHAQLPDSDKLARSVGDALTGVVYADDKTITVLSIRKNWADVGEKPGVDVRIERMR